MEVYMKYASRDLMDEHEGILHGLAILEKMALLVASDSGGIKTDLAAMIDFLRLFADKCHHGKEEGILFPAMEKYGIPKDGGPIGQMLIEHEKGREFIRGMSIAIATDEINKESFLQNAHGYIDLLRAHINKENTILFPMGDRAIPEAEQITILEAFETHERTVMGPGIHEKLHAMLDDFATKYQ
jgi:hemerythrin-like domain-containing protein